MTRTARASYPSAINKDRSEAKNGMDKHIPKGGAGPHNWGRLEDEYELESAALEDEQAEFEEVTGESSHWPLSPGSIIVGRTRQGSDRRSQGRPL